MDGTKAIEDHRAKNMISDFQNAAISFFKFFAWSFIKFHGFVTCFQESHIRERNECHRSQEIKKNELVVLFFVWSSMARGMGSTSVNCRN